MCAFIVALLLGWFTLGGVQLAEAARPSREAQQQAEGLSAEGWELWQKRQLADAAKKFEEAVELDPTNANAWNGLGWALFNGGQGNRALEAFEKCVKLVPKHPAGLNGLGQVYLSQGDLQQAEKYLKKAAPQAPAAWYGLARINLLRGNFKEAKIWAEKIVQGGGADPVAKQMLVAAVAEELDDELRQMIEPVSAPSPKQTPTPESADEEFEFPGTSDEEWRKRLLAVQQSDRWNVGAEIGMDLVRMPGDRPYEILKANWKEIASSARKQILKGFTPGMMGNEGVHSRFFDVMHLGMMDSNPGVRSYAAAYIEMQGFPNFEHDAKGYQDWRNKIEGLSVEEIMKQAKPKTEAADGKAEQENADLQRAWQMFFKRKYTTSERLFRRVLESEAENPHALNGLGWSLHNQGKSDEAKPLLEKAVELAPNHWGAISGLASVHNQQGNVDEAVKLWERVAKNSEGPNDATVALAEIYMERKQYQKAVSAYEKLIEWHPEQGAFERGLKQAKEGVAEKAE